MSIVISISENVPYCDRHGLIFERYSECYCGKGSRPDPGCVVCKGSGQCVTQEYPYTLLIQTGCFAQVWRAMGLSRSQTSVDGRVILDRLARIDIQGTIGLMQLSDEVNEHANVLVPTSRRAVDQMLRLLSQIAREATRRECNVFWK